MEKAIVLQHEFVGSDCTYTIQSEMLDEENGVWGFVFPGRMTLLEMATFTTQQLQKKPEIKTVQFTFGKRPVSVRRDKMVKSFELPFDVNDVLQQMASQLRA